MWMRQKNLDKTFEKRVFDQAFSFSKRKPLGKEKNGRNKFLIDLFAKKVRIEISWLSFFPKEGQVTL